MRVVFSRKLGASLLLFLIAGVEADTTCEIRLVCTDQRSRMELFTKATAAIVLVQDDGQPEYAEDEVVANYIDDFQETTPAEGWEYLWNESTAIGTDSGYVAMQWHAAGTQYSSDGGAPASTLDQCTFCRVDVVGVNGVIHPGEGTSQGAGSDRYVILRYTVAADGDYYIANGTANRTSASGNGTAISVLVENVAVLTDVIDPSESYTFQTALGTLSVGDTIDVAIGPNGHGSNDGLPVFDYDIVYGTNPPPESSILVYGDGEFRLPIEDIDDAAGKNGVYDVYWQPLDDGLLVGSPAVVEGVVILSDQGSSQLAFPEARGFGRFSVGGRSGTPTLYRITNGNDSGAGSARICLEASGPRFCVVQTFATVELASDIEVNDSFLTYAGQTGDLQFKDDDMAIRARSGSGAISNILFRYLKSRNGPDDPDITNGSSMTVWGDDATVSHVLFDHSDFMLHEDENFAFNGTVQNFSMQDSILGFALDTNNHSKCLLIQGTPSSSGFSFIRNAFMSCNDRFPLGKTGGPMEYVNNIYGLGVARSYSINTTEQGPMLIHHIKNYFYQPLPGGGDKPIAMGGVVGPYTSQSKLYLEANEHETIGTTQADLWRTNYAFTLEGSRIAGYSWFPESEEMSVADTRTYMEGGNVGAICPAADSLTAQMHTDLADDTIRVLTSVATIGGYPTPSGSFTGDDDNDGMDDEWENYASGNNGDLDPFVERANGYMNIENYLNDAGNDCVADGDYAWVQDTHDDQGGDTTAIRFWIRPSGAGHNPAGTYQDFAVTEL